MSAALGATLTDDDWRFLYRVLKDWSDEGFVSPHSPLDDRAEAIAAMIADYYTVTDPSMSL